MKTFDKEKVAKEFGKFVREEREKRGLYQADIAEMVGVSRVYYTHIEAGNRDIYFSLAMKICDALNLNIDDFAKRLK
jgi:transcriptional regulator with XRE-family HTH domain